MYVATNQMTDLSNRRRLDSIPNYLSYYQSVACQM